MVKINITEGKLRNLIKESINKTVKKYNSLINEETSLYSFSQNEHNLEIKNFDMSDIDDKTYIKEHINEIWGILESGYEKIGGFKGFQTPKDLLRKSPFVRIGYCDGEMITVAVYNSYLGGNKCVGLSCVKNERHSISVKLLELVLEYDIVNWQQWVWIEASGKVEEMCRNLNAFNVPSDYAVVYLKNIPYTVQDEYHYTIKISGKDETKTIFGFKDMEIFEMLKDDLNNQVNEFLKKIQSQDINENSSKQDEIYKRYIQKKGICQKYKDIIDYFIYLHEDELVNELPRESITVLEDTIKSLEDLLRSDEDLTIDRNVIEMTVEDGKELLTKFAVIYPLVV